MIRFMRANQSGISITELLVTLAIFWVVIGGVFSVLVLGGNTYNMGETQVDAQRQGRITFIRMVKEIRQCYEVVNLTDYPTNDYTISMRGIQITNEILVDTGDHQTYQSQHYPWLWDPYAIEGQQGAKPTIYVNGVVATSGYDIYSSGGQIYFYTTDSDRVVKADYTRDAYLKYHLSNGQFIRSVNNIDDEIIAEHVINQAQSAPVFSQADDLFTVVLTIDEDTSKPPPPYTLETEVRLRK